MRVFRNMFKKKKMALEIFDCKSVNITLLRKVYIVLEKDAYMMLLYIYIYLYMFIQ